MVNYLKRVEKRKGSKVDSFYDVGVRSFTVSTQIHLTYEKEVMGWYKKMMGYQELDRRFVLVDLLNEKGSLNKILLL